MAIDIRQQLALCLAALNNIHHVREDVHKAPDDKRFHIIYMQYVYIINVLIVYDDQI